MPFWNRKPAVMAAPPAKTASIFTTDPSDRSMARAEIVQAVERRNMPVTPAQMKLVGAGMDSNNWADGLKAMFRLGDRGGVPDDQLAWYGSQSFLGYQVCALMAQNWLVGKACNMPAKDAVRHGYELKMRGAGEEIDLPEVLRFIQHRDKRLALRRNLVEAVSFARVFGIRHVLFQVKNPPRGYYENPFNPDGVRPGMYAGMSQVDPYWLNPELSTKAASDPQAIDFYEPTWWVINGQRIHKSHFVILRGDAVADVYKPSYLYGGISVPQKIYERVYAAERTANEAPLLTLSKRQRTYKTDLAKIVAKGEGHLYAKLGDRSRLINNFGTDVVGLDDTVEHHETTLNDLDAVIMSQYQLVAAIANVPATKLLGTTPKGFNSSGDYEQDSYHEELEAIQSNDMEPIIERHHLMLMRSEVRPRFADLPADLTLDVVWEPVDSPTATEWATINKLKAETDKALMEAGGIDGQDVRERITGDKNSGYQGLPEVVSPAPLADEEPLA